MTSARDQVKGWRIPPYLGGALDRNRVAHWLEYAIFQRQHDLAHHVLQQVIQERQYIARLDRTHLGLLEKLTSRRDSSNRGKLLPTGRKTYHRRLPAFRPGPAEDPFQAETHLIQIDEGGPLLDLFFRPLGAWSAPRFARPPRSAPAPLYRVSGEKSPGDEAPCGHDPRGTTRPSAAR